MIQIISVRNAHKLRGWVKNHEEQLMKDAVGRVARNAIKAANLLSVIGTFVPVLKHDSSKVKLMPGRQTEPNMQNIPIRTPEGSQIRQALLNTIK